MIYDIALILDPSLTLLECHRIFETLKEKEVYVDFGIDEWDENGISIEASYDDSIFESTEELETFIEGIEGIRLDWDLMNEWVCEEMMYDD